MWRKAFVLRGTSPAPGAFLEFDGNAGKRLRLHQHRLRNVERALTGSLGTPLVSRDELIGNVAQVIADDGLRTDPQNIVAGTLD